MFSARRENVVCNKLLLTSAKAVAVLFLTVAAVSILRARGEAPTIFQDDNLVDPTSFKGYYVSAFQVHRGDNPDDHRGSSRARIGDHLRIGVIGFETWLEKLVTDGVLISPGGKHGDQLIDEQLPNIRLFIGWHLLTTLRPSHCFKDDPRWYQGNDQLNQDEAKQVEHGKRIWLDFSLVRDSNDKKSREDWSWLLKNPRSRSANASSRWRL